jgi:hypothetical protein
MSRFSISSQTHAGNICRSCLHSLQQLGSSRWFTTRHGHPQASRSLHQPTPSDNKHCRSECSPRHYCWENHSLLGKPSQNIPIALWKEQKWNHGNITLSTNKTRSVQAEFWRRGPRNQRSFCSIQLNITKLRGIVGRAMTQMGSGRRLGHTLPPFQSSRPRALGKSYCPEFRMKWSLQRLQVSRSTHSVSSHLESISCTSR